jgi:hypothetical protein
MKRLYNEGDQRQMEQSLRAAAVPPEKWSEAMRRFAIIQKLLRAELGCIELGFRRDQIIARFIVHMEAVYGQPLSRATLFNWKRAYFRASRCIAGLVDQRGMPSRNR